METAISDPMVGQSTLRKEWGAPIIVAAVQMESVLFARDLNLQRAGQYIEQAASHNSDLVILPELFSTGLCYDLCLCAHAEPIGGHTTRWLRNWSRTTGCYVGGTIIERCGQSCFNTFVLTGPDGATSIYRKRFPPFFENFVFGRGSRTGIIDTPLGRLGVLICWDMVQDRLVQRLRGRVDLVAVSAAWPDLDSGNIPLPVFQQWIARQPHRRQMGLAKSLSVPVIYANATGTFDVRVPLIGLGYRSNYAGGSSIIHADAAHIQQFERQSGVLLGRVQVPARSRSWNGAA
jgi:predicted amidohydrolase